MPPPPHVAAAASTAAAAAAKRLFSAAATSPRPPPPPRNPRGLPWSSSTFARTALPMFGFVVVAWFGLEQLIDSKLRIRAGVRGHDRLEEYDPLERVRRLAVESVVGGGGGGGEAKKKKGKDDAAAAAPRPPDVPSLEEELEAMNRKLGDTRKFEYVPVPRTDEDED